MNYQIMIYWKDEKDITVLFTNTIEHAKEILYTYRKTGADLIEKSYIYDLRKQEVL